MLLEMSTYGHGNILFTCSTMQTGGLSVASSPSKLMDMDNLVLTQRSPIAQTSANLFALNNSECLCLRCPSIRVQNSEFLANPIDVTDMNGSLDTSPVLLALIVLLKILAIKNAIYQTTELYFLCTYDKSVGPYIIVA